MFLENNSLISDEKELVTLFNTHYINIVEKSSGLKPNSINLNKANGTDVFLCAPTNYIMNEIKVKNTDINLCVNSSCLCIKIVEILEELKTSKDGRYYDNIVDMGERKFGWSTEDTKQQIQTGIDHNIIKEIMFRNRLAYRLIEGSSI